MKKGSVAKKPVAIARPASQVLDLSHNASLQRIRAAVAVNAKLISEVKTAFDALAHSIEFVRKKIAELTAISRDCADRIEDMLKTSGSVPPSAPQNAAPTTVVAVAPATMQVAQTQQEKLQAYRNYIAQKLTTSTTFEEKITLVFQLRAQHDEFIQRDVNLEMIAVCDSNFHACIHDIRKEIENLTQTIDITF